MIPFDSIRYFQVNSSEKSAGKKFLGQRASYRGLISAVLSARQPSDLVIYALLEGQEGVWVGGGKILTTRRVSVDSDQSKRYLLRVSVGVSCSQSPSL